MRRQTTLAIAAFTIALSGASATTLAATKINWWHAMGGALGERVANIAKGFNESQSEYEVVATYKGNYTETMTAGIAAFRSGKQPHILQVFEVGTATMMAAKGAIKPVYQLMAETGEPFDPSAYLPTVTGYYMTSDGKLLSMPFNSSTPVLYYNKDAFRKAGLDPESPPKTWPELAAAAKKTQAAGYPCGFTTAWQSWIQIENFSAWHNLPIGTKANGFAGLDTELVINSPEHVKHIQRLADWTKDKTFVYGGRRGDSQALFTNGECAMYMQSSAGLAGIRKTAKFEFGVGMLPYWPDIAAKPQNTIIGGATLWVFAGHPAEEYKGVARFFSYLSSPKVQAEWHQGTGYLPITFAAYELTKKQGYYDKFPGAEVALKQMTLNPPTENSRGLRFGNFVQIRDIINEELEAVWGGKKTAKQALDSAVARGNVLLRKFERANK
ncbi:MAG: sn-glycerol-3-phosphate ABC transporter substrate-binding protein UgpB [Alphaproteobacteria bacterium]|nr:MAG: sn-glycerol-3-phosphate ABC transporter substrate-binding protein UgpB [Alphaproteobacteria bacterium]